MKNHEDLKIAEVEKCLMEYHTSRGLRPHGSVVLSDFYVNGNPHLPFTSTPETSTSNETDSITFSDLDREFQQGIAAPIQTETIDIQEVDRKSRASVLIALFLTSDGEIHVWLTKRSIHLSTHSGEIALPGGKCDECDEDEIATSLREAEEEIGLLASQVKVVTQLEPFLSKHLLIVTPVVGLLTPNSKFTPIPNDTEVDEVFHVPLEAFLQERGHSQKDVEWLGLPYRIHYFDFFVKGVQYNIWGLTAAILIRAASVSFNREPEFQEWHPEAPHNRFASELNKRGLLVSK